MKTSHFGWTDEREIPWIKEHHDHLGVDLIQAQTGYTAVNRTWQVPSRGGIAWFKHFISPIDFYAHLADSFPFGSLRALAHRLRFA